MGVVNGVAHTGSKSLCNNGTTCFTIMPDEGLNYGADSVWLTFWYYLHNNTDYFEVGYLTDPTDSSTFHVLDNMHLTSTPCAAWGLRIAENREDSVRLEWESAGDPTVTLTINRNTPYSVTGNSFIHFIASNTYGTVRRNGVIEVLR